VLRLRLHPGRLRGVRGHVEWAFAQQRVAGLLGVHAQPRCHQLPGPGSAGGGLNLGGTGINPFSPSFKTAQFTCRKLLPGVGPGAHKASEQEKQQLVAVSESMRRHGVSGFPDPTSTPPTSSQGYSIMGGLGSNLFLLVPSSIDVNSPVFTKAAKTCHFS
jgi:hypothetical protein